MAITPTVKPRRLFIDLETSPNVVLSWRIGYKINLSHDNIVQERKIIVIGYKHEGDKKITTLVWDKNMDDKRMLGEFLKVAHEADEIVGHNSDSFDIPWFRTRCLIHGLEPLPPYKTVDTLKLARRNYLFNCNKLTYLGEVLGLGKKIDTGFGLWRKVVLENDREALAQMAVYCARDIDLLEQVYHKLKFCTKPKTHAGVLAGGDRWQCPRDGSEDVTTDKKRVTASGMVQFQMKCKTCGGYHTISSTAHEAYLLHMKKKKKKVKY